MSDFTLPTNIKQIGSIGDGLRIYIEDYVCTFLQQYAESAGYSERLAFLVGRHIVIDNQPIVFINGAIHGKHTEESEGFLRFSEKSIEYAQAMMEEHFGGLEIVGWMQSQPSYGTFLNQHYAAYHLRQFRKAYQVMFVCDPLERMNAFYAPNPTAMTPTERVKEQSGYFIYYDKNINMHEYMLANKAIDYTAKTPTFVDIQPAMSSEDEIEFAELNPPPSEENDEDDMPLVANRYNYRREEQDDEQEELRQPSRYVNQPMRKRGTALHRRPMQLIGSLCAVLLVIVFVMGFELVRNQDRIDRMETEIQFLTTGYRNLLAQMHRDDLVGIFADQGIFTDEPTVPVGPATGELPGTPPAPGSPAETPAPPTASDTYDADETIPVALMPGAVAFPEVPAFYVIQPGDSLIGISVFFFGDDSRVAEIIALNEIENPDHIVTGMTLQLPRR